MSYSKPRLLLCQPLSADLRRAHQVLCSIQSTLGPRNKVRNDMLSEARRGETPAAPGRYARSVDGGEYLSRRLLRREADARCAHPSLQRTSGAPFIGTTDPRHVRLPHRAFTHVTRVTSSSSRLEFIQFTSHCLLFLINIFPHYTPSHACIHIKRCRRPLLHLWTLPQKGKPHKERPLRSSPPACPRQCSSSSRAASPMTGGSVARRVSPRSSPRGRSRDSRWTRASPTPR
jgi:hypothetical protein